MDKQRKLNYDNLVTLLSECAIDLRLNDSFIPEMILNCNIKYFDIFDESPIFNIFNIVNIEYIFKKGICYIKSNKSHYKNISAGDIILSVNNKPPAEGISKKYDIYYIEYLKLNARNQYIKKSAKILYPQLDYKSYSKLVIKERKNNIYIKIDNFNQEIVLQNIELNNKSLWIDLRNNRGGSITNLIKCLQIFVKEGNPLFYLSKKNEIYSILSKTLTMIIPYKIYVFVNSKTASSSEIMASVLKKSVGAVILGSKTEGKWMITADKKLGIYNVKLPEFIYQNNTEIQEPTYEGIVPDYIISDNRIDEFINKKWCD